MATLPPSACLFRPPPSSSSSRAASSSSNAWRAPLPTAFKAGLNVFTSTRLKVAAIRPGDVSLSVVRRSALREFQRSDVFSSTFGRSALRPLQRYDVLYAHYSQIRGHRSMANSARDNQRDLHTHLSRSLLQGFWPA